MCRIYGPRRIVPEGRRTPHAGTFSIIHVNRHIKEKEESICQCFVCVCVWFPVFRYTVEMKYTAAVWTCKPGQEMSIHSPCSPWGLQWWSSGHLRWNAGDSIKDSGYGPQTNLLWQTGGVLLFPDPVMNRGLESPMLSCQSGAGTDWGGDDSRLMLQASSLSSKTHRMSPLALLPFDSHFTQAADPRITSETHLAAEPKTYSRPHWSLLFSSLYLVENSLLC